MGDFLTIGSYASFGGACNGAPERLLERIDAALAAAPHVRAVVVATDDYASRCLAALVDGGVLYSSDLSDEELARLWVESPEKLGSISVGLTEAGRLVNGVQLSPGSAWQLVDAHNAWGTQETVDFLTAAANSVREQFPAAAPLRINHIGKQNGGYLRPHQSHQAGRDVDLGFYYPRGEDPGHLSKKRPGDGSAGELGPAEGPHHEGRRAIHSRRQAHSGPPLRLRAQAG
jgi:hypothetical protein